MPLAQREMELPQWWWRTQAACFQPAASAFELAVVRQSKERTPWLAHSPSVVVLPMVLRLAVLSSLVASQLELGPPASTLVVSRTQQEMLLPACCPPRRQKRAEVEVLRWSVGRPGAGATELAKQYQRSVHVSQAPMPMVAVGCLRHLERGAGLDQSNFLA